MHCAFHIPKADDRDSSEVNRDEIETAVAKFAEEAVTYDPIVEEMIEGNVRTAAILGTELRPARLALAGNTDEEFFTTTDIASFLSPSAFKYKQLNRLQSVEGPDDMCYLLTSAVRMHVFPNSFHHDYELVSAYGMVVDTAHRGVSGREETLKNITQLHKWNVSNEPSRYDLPPFSMAILALLSGRSPVTETIMKGQSLRQYWLSVSYLLGRAACSGSLFAELLAANNGGSLRPLQTVNEKQTERSLMSEIKNLTLENRSKQLLKRKYLTQVAEAIKPLTYRANCCYLAAIGSPVEFPFANSVLFIDDRLFLFHVCEDLSRINVPLERWKMGAVDDAALAAFMRSVRNGLKMTAKSAEKVLASITSRSSTESTFPCLAKAQNNETASDTSYELLKELSNLAKRNNRESALLQEIALTYQAKINIVGGLAKIWNAQTNKPITSVQRVIVTTAPYDKPPANTSEQYQFTSTYDFLAVGGAAQDENTRSIRMECDLFVSVDQIKFLRFQPKTSRPSMMSLIAAPKGDTATEENNQNDTATEEDNQNDKPTKNAIQARGRAMKLRKAKLQTKKSKKARSQMRKRHLRTRSFVTLAYGAPLTCGSGTTLTAPLGPIQQDISTTQGCIVRGGQGQSNPNIWNTADAIVINVGVAGQAGLGGARSLSFVGTTFTNVQLAINTTNTAEALSATPFLFSMTGCSFTIANRPYWSYGIVFMGRTLPYGSQITFSDNKFDFSVYTSPGLITFTGIDFLVTNWVQSTVLTFTGCKFSFPNITLTINQGLIIAVSTNIFASYSPYSPASPTSTIGSSLVFKGNSFEAISIVRSSASIASISLTIAFVYFYMPLALSSGGSILVDGLQYAVEVPASSVFSYVAAIAVYVSNVAVSISNAATFTVKNVNATINNTATAALARFEGGLLVESSGQFLLQLSSLAQVFTNGWNTSSSRCALVILADKKVSISGAMSGFALNDNQITSTNAGVDAAINAETVLALALFLKVASGVEVNSRGSLLLSNNKIASYGVTTGIPQEVGGKYYAFRGGLFFYTSPLTITDIGSAVMSHSDDISIEGLRSTTSSTNTGIDIIAFSIGFFSTSPLKMMNGGRLIASSNLVNVTVRGIYSTMINLVYAESSLFSIAGNDTEISVVNSTLSLSARTAGTKGPYDLTRSLTGTSDVIAVGIRATSSITFQDGAQLKISGNAVLRDSSFVFQSVVALFAAVVYGNVLFNTGSGALFEDNFLRLWVGGASTGSADSEFASLFVFGGTILRVQASGRMVFSDNTIRLSLIDGGVGKANNVGTLKLRVSCLSSPSPSTTLDLPSGSFLTFSRNELTADAGSTIVSMCVLSFPSATVNFAPPIVPSSQYTEWYDVGKSPQIILSQNVLSVSLSPFQAQQQQSITGIASFADLTGSTLTASQSQPYGNFLFGMCRNYLNDWLRDDVAGSAAVLFSIAPAPQCYTRTTTVTNDLVPTPSQALTLSNPITPSGGWKPPRTASDIQTRSLSTSITGRTMTIAKSSTASSTTIVGCPTSCSNLSMVRSDGQTIGSPCHSSANNTPSSAQPNALLYEHWAPATVSIDGYNGTIVRVPVTIAWASTVVPLFVQEANMSTTNNNNSSWYTYRVESVAASHSNETSGGPVNTVVRITFEITFSNGLPYDKLMEAIGLGALLSFGCTDEMQTEYPQLLRIGVLLLPYTPTVADKPVLDPSIGDAGGIGSVIGIVGGGAAAADMQTLALLGLNACSQSTTDRNARPKTTGMALRLLAPAAIGETCEGALIGNFILVGAVAALQLLVTIILMKVQKKSFPAAMDTARFPSLTLVLLMFLQNGFLLCGFDVIRHDSSVAALGYLGANWTVVPIVLYLVISFKVASRAYYPIIYRIASPWNIPTKLILPRGQLDNTIIGTEMFSSVVGTFQHPYRGLVMCHFMGFIAAAPIVVGIGKTCEPMYILAISLHVLFAAAVAIIRPHRVLFSNILQPFCLICNAIIIAHYLILLRNPTTIPRDLSASLQIMAITQTVFTSMRVVQSILQVGVTVAARRWPTLAPYPLSCAWEIANWPSQKKGSSNFGYFKDGVSKTIEVEELLEMGVAGRYDEEWGADEDNGAAESCNSDIECKPSTKPILNKNSPMGKEMSLLAAAPQNKTTPHLLTPQSTAVYLAALEDPLLGSGTSKTSRGHATSVAYVPPTLPKKEALSKGATKDGSSHQVGCKSRNTNLQNEQRINHEMQTTSAVAEGEDNNTIVSSFASEEEEESCE